MKRKFLLNPFDEAQRQTEEPGKWVVATVDPRMSWPTQKQLVGFNDKEFVLFAGSNDENQTAAIAIRADRYGLSPEDARREIMRFCSALSWKQGRGISIVAWGGGASPSWTHMLAALVLTSYDAHQRVSTCRLRPVTRART